MSIPVPIQENITEAFDFIAQNIAYSPLKKQTLFKKRYESLKVRFNKGLPVDKGVLGLEKELRSAIKKIQQRLKSLPEITYPEELPIAQKRDAIKQALEKHQIIIICGETGSGKTTQLPKICLAMGRGILGTIAHTQPRRIAARSVAHRIATELNVSLGELVGYKVRFDDKSGEHSCIKLMTDGILLNEIQTDPDLLAYDTIIVDEAHERSLNIDFLIGYLKGLAERRPELKIIITSATIDPERFGNFFQAPIIHIPGRSYPVEIFYKPYYEEEDIELIDALTQAIDELIIHQPGDILIFLPTERDIHEQLKLLRQRFPEYTILPLFSRLSNNEQNQVFVLKDNIRIILSTNVAETSLTVPGIRYVIDTGTARISRYSPKAKIQRLPIEAISQASANQRAGRCGRVSEGVCIRLYSQEDFAGRAEFTTPEILRTNLASVILQLSALNLAAIETFPFMERPDTRFIQDGYKLLHMLGALDEGNHINELGKRLARIPIDPRLGRMLLAAEELNCLPEMAILVSGLSIVDPRERPHDKQQASDQAHRRFMDKTSDFLSLLNLWRYYQYQSKNLSNQKLKQLCKKEYLSYHRMREWMELKQQLETLMLEQKWHLTEKQLPFIENEAELEALVYENWSFMAIHKALLTGLLDHIGLKDEISFLGARNRRFYIFPGSGLFKKPPKWIMVEEIAETTKVWGRMAAKIEPEWLEVLADHLLKKQYFEPFWDKKRQTVMGYEKVLLYGLPIIPRRTIAYTNIDAALSHEIFLRNGLISDEVISNAEFIQHNKRIMQEITALEAKYRCTDWQLTDEMLYLFYSEHLPIEVNSTAALNTWVAQNDQRVLYLKKEDYLPDLPDNHIDLYPDILKIGDISLPLTYVFNPSDEQDGITVKIPLALLKQMDEAYFSWLIPGLLEEKIIYLIKNLPKSLRRNLVPVPDVAKACLAEIKPYQGHLLKQLNHALKRVKMMDIPLDSWSEPSIPEYLRFYFMIYDQQNVCVAEGRDLIDLKAKLAAESKADFEKRLQQVWQRDNVTDWDFDWPEIVSFESGGLTLQGYPAVIAKKDNTVSLRLVEDETRAYQESIKGVRQLFFIKSKEYFKNLDRQIPNLQNLCLRYIRLGNCDDLKQDLKQVLLDHVFEIYKLPKTKEQFNQRLQAHKSKLLPQLQIVAELIAKILEGYTTLQTKLEKLNPLLEATQDIQDQLTYLVYPRFIGQTPYIYLKNYPRYFSAIEKRIEKLSYEPDRDRTRCSKVVPLWQHFKACWQQYQDDPALMEYRWMLEEWRIHIFAQEVGTSTPISEQRMKKQWQKTECSN